MSIPACIIKDYQTMPKIKLEQAIENLTRNADADCVIREGCSPEWKAEKMAQRRIYDEMLTTMKQILATR